MSGRKTVSVVAIAVLLASSMLVGVTLLQQEGFLPGVSPTTSESSSLSTSISTRTSTITSTTRPTTPAGSGTLVLQIHDPPNVPAGVTAVYVTYSEIWLGSSDGKLVDLNQSGTINLMSVVNFTQTIVNAKVQTGTFDMIVMNISSVLVTWNAANYSASITNDQLTAPMVGDLNISNLATTGAVIDVSPTIIQHVITNSTGGQSTSFVMVPSANAYIVPSNQLSQTQTRVGDREDVRNQTWLTGQINETTSQTGFTILSSSLSNSSFVIAVKNTGSRSVRIQSVFVATNSSQTQANEGDRGLNIGSSILFSVLQNGTLVPYGSAETTGYNLSAHGQTVFSYLGQIPPIQIYTGGQGSDNSGTMIGGVTTTTTSGEMGRALVGSTPLDSGGDTNSYGFKIIAGQNYLVGASSGDATSTTVIIAT